MAAAFVSLCMGASQQMSQVVENAAGEKCTSRPPKIDRVIEKDADALGVPSNHGHQSAK